MQKINNFIDLLENKINSDPELAASMRAAGAELDNLDMIQRLRALNNLKNKLNKLGFKI